MNHLDKQTRLALRLRSLSLKRWGPDGEVKLLGRHKSFREAQKRLLQFAAVDRPILISGESGVGKEMFARSLYLLSPRSGQPFVSVNCAQFQSEDLLVSELFGHTAGAFTGATYDRTGLFEQADGGIVFLDEVGELTPKAQAMLLRALGEGEVLPLGQSTPRYVDVRVVAATNRDLAEQVEAGAFRTDLFYRLCYLHLLIPPLRDRGADWQIILDDYLDDLNYEHGLTDAASQRLLTPDASDLLSAHHWPGNVRELQAVVDVGFCLAVGTEIGPEHVCERLNSAPRIGTGHLSTGIGQRDRRGRSAANLDRQETWAGGVASPMAVNGASVNGAAGSRAAPSLPPSNAGTAPEAGGEAASEMDPLSRYRAMEAGETDFWDVIRAPYLDRELNRAQVRVVITCGLRATGGSYKRLLPIFGIDEDDYLKFMDFLRHHRLKPPQPW